MPRAARFVLLTACALLLTGVTLAGCGASPALPPGPRVTLSLSAPIDASRTPAAYATVRGTVKPADVRVEVLGQSVPVSRQGRFSSRVELAVGTNLVDVIASAPRSTGAVTALSVVRFLLVTVPQVAGESSSQATAALRQLGLAVQVDKSSDLLNLVIPGAQRVCSSSPAGGSRVDPGTLVTLHTAKLCGF